MAQNTILCFYHDNFITHLDNFSDQLSTNPFLVFIMIIFRTIEYYCGAGGEVKATVTPMIEDAAATPKATF